MHIDCINRFEPLSEQADSSCSDEHIDTSHVDVNLVEGKVKALGGNKREKRLRVATVLCAKRPHNSILQSLLIFSIIQHAIQTQDIPT